MPLDAGFVDNVQLKDSDLTWTYRDDKRSGHANTNQIVFITHAAQPNSNGHIICCLKEDTDNLARPFELLLLTTEAPVQDGLLRAHLLLSLPHHLQRSSGNEVDVVVSTKSGIGQAEPFWQHVVRPLLQVVHQTSYSRGEDDRWNLIITRDEHSVHNYAKTIRLSGPSRTIILISGDGGVVDLLNGRETITEKTSIEQGNLPLLALLPLGTGNALFHSLHKPLETTPGPTPLVLALRTLLHGTPAKLPMFKASFTPGSHIVSYTSRADADDPASVYRQDKAVSFLYGAIVASYAFHASIVYESDSPEYRVHGSKRFGMVAQQLLRQSHPYRASVDVKTSTTDFERDPHDTHGYVLVSMVSNLEKSFTISPDTKPLDGTLHLLHMGPVGEKKLMEAMMAAYDGGKHTKLEWEDGEKVRYQEVESVRVTTQEDDERWRKFCVDGTIVNVEKGGGMVVEAVDETAYRILVDEKVRI